MKYNERITGTNARRMLALCDGPNGTYWQDRHRYAVVWPRGIERPFRDMLTAWVSYATEYERQHESPIGEDGYAGQYWLEIGKALRALLSSDNGNRLDNGTLDGFILQVIGDHGFDLKEEGL